MSLPAESDGAPGGSADARSASPDAPTTNVGYRADELSRLNAVLLGADDPRWVGRYRILERIGEGGMGAVYKAEQKHPMQRIVALKLIKAGMDSRQVIARFDSERQALAWMDHPNVARVLDAGADPVSGRPYFVMEYVPGLPITRYCDEHKLTIAQRLRLFLQVCDAVTHAHQKMIVHRDLKPSNILVSSSNGPATAYVKVIDFGVAKAMVSRLTDRTLFTESGQMLGTPEYMSPEQARGDGAQGVDTRSDIYSMGVVLYELLAGTLPFDPQALRGAGPAEVERTIRETDPPRPSTRLSSLSDAQASEVARRRQMQIQDLTRQLRSELEWIPLKAMRKERSQRYASASELAQDIGNYLESRPLIAGPESAGYRARKFLVRNREAIAAAVVIAVVTAGLLSQSAALAAAFAVVFGIGAAVYVRGIRRERARTISLEKVISETRQRARVTQRFGSYVDPALVDFVIGQPQEPALQGEVREVTVAFTDLVGFTAMTTTLQERVLPVLNQYMALMLPIIRRHGGLVNKFLGDGLMFFYGAPRKHPRKAHAAVETLLEMLAALASLNEALAARNLPILKLRGGIATRNVIVGDAGAIAGDEQASDYTVLGDGVNLAARLEASNKHFGSTVLVDEHTYEMVREDFLFRLIGQLKVKETNGVVRVYEPICATASATPQQQQEAQAYAALVQAYHRGEFSKCLELIAQIEQRAGPNDTLRIYRSSCEHFRQPSNAASFSGDLLRIEG